MLFRSPFLGSEHEISPNWKVEAYPTREAFGLVWVWYGDAEPADELPWFDALGAGVGRTWQTHSVWPYHYTRLMDSNFDVYHFPFVHRSVNPGLGPVVVEHEVRDLGDRIDTRVTLDAYGVDRRVGRARKTERKSVV